MTTGPKVNKSEADWRKQLTPEQYHITREHGTERPFSHPYNKEKAAGTYMCPAAPRFSGQRPNMIRAQAGRAFTSRSMRMR